MNSDKFIMKCQIIIYNYLKELLKVEIDTDLNIYVVWQVKALQNYKALLSTNDIINKYFEITYDGNKNRFYVDVYNKEKNYVVDG